MDWEMSEKYKLPHLPNAIPPSPLTNMRCTKTISRPGMASYRLFLLTSHCVLECVIPVQRTLNINGHSEQLLSSLII